MNTAYGRVATGVRLLDRHRPEWRNHISPAILCMASGRDCILGQLYGDYITGRQTIGIDSTEEADAYGFTSDAPTDSEREADFSDLQAEWLDRIREITG